MEINYSLESDIDENIQKIWNTEDKKRRNEIQNHTVELISGEIALAQIQTNFRKMNIEFCSTQDNIETEYYEKCHASIQTQRKN